MSELYIKRLTVCARLLAYHVITESFWTVVRDRKIPPAAAANQIASKVRIPPAAKQQKNKPEYFTTTC